MIIAIRNSSGVYICKSEENDLKHGNYICKSEEIYLRSSQVRESHDDNTRYYIEYDDGHYNEPRDIQPIAVF
jgi:hypothetical protein